MMLLVHFQSMALWIMSIPDTQIQQIKSEIGLKNIIHMAIV